MADWEAARPYLDYWTGERIGDFLDRNPEVIGRIIYDIYDEVRAEQEREQGHVQMGRRSHRKAVSLEEVWEVVFPEAYSMDPFPEAMRTLLNGRSQRQFARKIPCHQTTLSRMMAGTLEPQLSMLERIAEAAGVQPGYFVEYRAQYLGEFVARAFRYAPHKSVKALRLVKP